MQDVYRSLRRAIQKDARDITIQPCKDLHAVTAYLDLHLKKPFTDMHVREYLVDQIVSLCVRTGSWSISSIRFSIRRISITGRSKYRLHLSLASQWRDEDAHRLDELFIHLGERVGKKTRTSARTAGSSLWCLYVIGACLHEEGQTPRLFGVPGEFVYFFNENFVPYTGKNIDDEFELVPTMVSLLESGDEIRDKVEAHNNSLGELVELSAFTAITAEEDGDTESEIEKLLAAADDAFSESSFGSPLPILRSVMG